MILMKQLQLSPRNAKLEKPEVDDELKAKRKSTKANKSFEGEFLNELENQYELSPKLSSLILGSAKNWRVG